MSKKLIRLTESDLHRIVNNVINEVYGGFNQFSDGDFASDGDPYELSDIAEEDELLNLSGLYNLYGKKAFIDDNEENPKIRYGEKRIYGADALDILRKVKNGLKRKNEYSDYAKVKLLAIALRNYEK